MTFIPCFLWIFLGAPFMETMRNNKALSAALAAITAAVVGVILNLAIWFALHVLFRDLQEANGFGMNVDLPVLTSFNIPSLILTLGAIIAVFRFKVGMHSGLAARSILELLYGLLMGWSSA